MRRRLRAQLTFGRQLIALGVLLGVATGALAPGMAAGSRAPDQARQGEFMWGMAGQESGWNYYARNASSGAYGRYQIMPQNWPSWAARYVGDRWADQDPHTQERVARGKIADLHRWLGSWRRVAYWWLTGDTERDEDAWSDMARGYVRNVMTLMKRAPDGGDPMPPAPADDSAPAERGDWRLAARGSALFDDTTTERRRVGRVRQGQILFVQRSTWGGTGVLWMHVSTAGGAVGWISIRRTLPARKPANAGRYPRGSGDGGGGGEERDRRERARPRPR